MSNEPRAIFPGSKARKPQYVLGTENGTKRTSNVTEAKIVEAVEDIEDNVAICVSLWWKFTNSFNIYAFSN